jgi:hypothetical protein
MPLTEIPMSSHDARQPVLQSAAGETADPPGNVRINRGGRLPRFFLYEQAGWTSRAVTAH